MTDRRWIFLVVLVIFVFAGVSSGVASAASQAPAGTTLTATGGQPHSGLTDLGQRGEAADHVPSTQQPIIGTRVADRMILVAAVVFSALLTLFLGARILLRRRASKAKLSGGLVEADRGTSSTESADTRQPAFAHRKTDIADPIHYRVAS